MSGKGKTKPINQKTHPGVYIGLLAFILFIIYACGAFTSIGYPPFWKAQTSTYYDPNRPSTTKPVPTGTIPVGTFSVLDVAYNALDISSALTLGTHVDQNFWGFRNGGWVLLGAHGASGTNLELTQTDAGYIYIMMKPHGASAYIAAAAQVLAMNARAVSSQFVDPDGDNVKEFVIKWSMFNVPPAASGYPSTTFTGYYYADISASASLTGPVDRQGLSTYSTSKSTYAYTTLGTTATSTTTKTDFLLTTTGSTTILTQQTYYSPWYMTFGTSKTALAISKIVLKANSTYASQAQLKNVYVPGKGVLSDSSADYSTSDTSQYWTFTFGSNLGNCLYWVLPNNSQDKQDFTTFIEYTLPVTSEVQWTITIYAIGADQSVVTFADTIQVTALS